MTKQDALEIARNWVGGLTERQVVEVANLVLRTRKHTIDDCIAATLQVVEGTRAEDRYAPDWHETVSAINTAVGYMRAMR